MTLWLMYGLGFLAGFFLGATTVLIIIREMKRNGKHQRRY